MAKNSALQGTAWSFPTSGDTLLAGSYSPAVFDVVFFSWASCCGDAAKLVACLELGQFEVEVDDLVTVEYADVFCFAGHSVRLGSNLVIDIRAEPVKVILAILFGNKRSHLKTMPVLQQHTSSGYANAGLI